MTNNRTFNRRDFLRYSLAGTCGAAIHRAFTPLNSMLAFAAPVASAISSSPVLVLVNFAGGASYNWAPIYNGSYISKSPGISYDAAHSLAINADQGLHPALTDIKQIYDQGHLALVNLVGYPNPNRSHDESTQIWFRGVRNGGSSYGGWAARLTCQVAETFSGVSLGGSNLLIQGECNPPQAFGNLDNFGENSFKWNDDLTDWLRITRQAVVTDSSSSATDNLTFIRSAMTSVESTAAVVKQQTSQALPAILNDFPDSSFGTSCRDAARLIQATALKVRFIYLEIGGFDTHSDEKSRLTDLMTDVNAGLRSLVQTIKALNRWQDVIIVNMSEFSRTFENGSGGSDHGHAGPVMVMGGAVQGGIKSPTPTTYDINTAEDYFHDYHVDFRQIFKESIAAMGYDPSPIFPEAISYTPLGIFA